MWAIRRISQHDIERHSLETSETGTDIITETAADIAVETERAIRLHH